MTTNKKHNYKLSDDDKKSILLEYQLNHSKENIKAICNKYSITKQSIYDLVKKTSTENINELTTNSIKDYNENFTKRANEIIALMLERLYKQVKEDDKITIAQLTTSLGILYDKMRLNTNSSTSNSSININIKIE